MQCFTLKNAELFFNPFFGSTKPLFQFFNYIFNPIQFIFNHYTEKKMRFVITTFFLLSNQLKSFM